MFIGSRNEPPNWSQFTLVIPAVSVGNVGQLAVDLLIFNLNMRPVGCLHDDSFLPMVGNDPFNESTSNCELVTAATVYESSEKKLLAIQQRTPLVKGKYEQYITKLMDWIVQYGFAKVVVLTSSSAHERRDTQLTGIQLRFLMSALLLEEKGNQLKNLNGWLELEQRLSVPGTATYDEDSKRDGIFIPGGGISKQLYLKCCEKKIPVAVLMRFVAEGDNANDAFELAGYFNEWCQWLTKTNEQPGSVNSWSVPPSWKFLFGNSYNNKMF